MLLFLCVRILLKYLGVESLSQKEFLPFKFDSFWQNVLINVLPINALLAKDEIAVFHSFHLYQFLGTSSIFTIVFLVSLILN